MRQRGWPLKAASVVNAPIRGVQCKVVCVWNPVHKMMSCKAGTEE
jgi:hypothetical protein